MIISKKISTTTFKKLQNLKLLRLHKPLSSGRLGKSIHLSAIGTYFRRKFEFPNLNMVKIPSREIVFIA